MIDAYKRFPLKYQALAIGALTVVAFIIGWKSTHEPFVVAGFVLGGLILLHIFLTKLNSLLAFIVILLQSAIYTGLIIGVYAYGTEVANMLTIDVNLIAIMLASFGLVLIATYVYAAYRFSRGRLWLNLTTAFIIAGLTTTTILIFATLFYVLALVAGFFAGLLYLILRSPNNKKRPTLTRSTLVKNRKEEVEKLFQANGLEYVEVPSSSFLGSGHYFAYTNQTAFLITVAAPSKTFSVSSAGILCDKTNLVPLLEFSQEQILKNKKFINPDLVIPVLLVLSSSKNLKPITSVSISKWKQPDFALGITHILTSKGFERFVRATAGEMKPLKPSHKEKIVSFSQNLTSN